MRHAPAPDLSKRVAALEGRPPVASVDAAAPFADASSLGFGWRGVTIWEQTTSSHQELLLPPLSDHHIVILVEGNGSVEQVRADGRHESEWVPGDFSFVPRATATGWRMAGVMRLVHVDLGPAFFRGVCLEVCSVDPNHLRLADGFHAHDAELLTLALWLLREITTNAVDGPLYAESIGVLIAVHALRAFARQPRPIFSARGGLPKPRLRRALDHIDANLVRTIAVSDLAALCNYSRFHFSRAFKQSTGLPPRQYQIRLRAERARELIETTRLPIGEIAAEVGYDCPSQFARAFRKEWGVSPSLLRRQCEEALR